MNLILYIRKKHFAFCNTVKTGLTNLIVADDRFRTIFVEVVKIRGCAKNIDAVRELIKQNLHGT